MGGAGKILVTGGAGYIGSHTVVILIEAGYDVVILDNLMNSSEESLSRVEKLTGARIPFHKVDLLEKSKIEDVFKSDGPFDACIHFAGLKAVGESVSQPLQYYHNNLTGTIYLLEVLAANNCKNIVFSSSATVYGFAKELPVTEETKPIGATNPYGRTKEFIEYFLQDLYVSDPTWNIVILRYFNPVGAHESGTIGEDPVGIPNNIMPFIAQTAVGRREKLTIFGNDYDTKDGTAVRDFIHVVDLAKGHMASIKLIAKKPGVAVYNLGTGTGYSVLELVKAFEKASGKPVPYVFGARRPGDVVSLFCEPSKAERELGWKAELDLDRMCADSWRWQSQNPAGYKSNL